MENDRPRYSSSELSILRKTPVVEVLRSLGYEIVRDPRTKLFRSPFREESKGSFKIDENQNQWFDHGNTDSKFMKQKKDGTMVSGGDVIDLVMMLRSCSFPDAIDYLASFNPSIISSIDTEKATKANGILSQFINHSGGARGSDTAWGTIGAEYGVESRHYYYKDKTPSGNTPISEAQFIEGREHVREANKTLNRMLSNKYMPLLARNWFQVKNSDEIFAIGHFAGPKPGIVAGGTGWAVQMAIDSGKTVNLFDQEKDQWYRYQANTGWFELPFAPELTKNFAGIGTRELKPNGEKAIRDCYHATEFSVKEERKRSLWKDGIDPASLSLEITAHHPFPIGIREFDSPLEYLAYARMEAFSSMNSEERMTTLDSAKKGDRDFELRRIADGYFDDYKVEQDDWDMVRDNALQTAYRFMLRTHPDLLASLLNTHEAPFASPEGDIESSAALALETLRASFAAEYDGEVETYEYGEKIGVIDAVLGFSLPELMKYADTEKNIPESVAKFLKGAREKKAVPYPVYKLLEYVCKERCIPEPVLRKYCKLVAVHFERELSDGEKEIGNTVYAIGFPMDSGQFVLRKEPQKTSDGTVSGMKINSGTGADITTLPFDPSKGKEHPSHPIVCVFEGFMDFMSWYAWRKLKELDCDVVVLNSTAYWRRSVKYVAEHEKVCLFLDNDKAGTECVERLTESISRENGKCKISDRRSTFAGNNDINEAFQQFMKKKKEHSETVSKSR